MRRLSPYVALVVITCLGSTIDARGDPCDRLCENNIACYDEMLRCLAEDGQAHKAIEKAKKLKNENPEDHSYALLLAKAYEAAGNHFWALKTLLEELSRHQQDCDATAYLAWFYVQQGDLDLAKERLASEYCPKSQADSSRWAILLSLLARMSGDDEQAGDLLNRIWSFEKTYPEDALMAQNLRRQLDPAWTQPVHIRAELASGITSNISAGLPVTQAGSDKSSGLLKISLFGRWIWPLWRSIKPTAELNAKLNALDDFEYDDSVDVHGANYFDGSLRLGLKMSIGSMPGFIGYKGDVFSLNQGDRFQKAPVVFYEGHRLELELEPGAGLMIFAGGGKRFFRQISRSRIEVDGGLGWSLSPWNWLQVLAAASIRYYRSDGQLYDQAGVTAILVGRLSLPAGMLLRSSLSTGWDWYPNAAPEQSTNRDQGGTDLLIKPGLSVWSPAWGNIRLGISYEFSKRISDTSISYSYSDHRALLKVRWTYESNPWAPEQVEDADRLRFPWNTSNNTGNGFDEERIQDLLRQDEASRRGSSCVN